MGKANKGSCLLLREWVLKLTKAGKPNCLQKFPQSNTTTFIFHHCSGFVYLSTWAIKTVVDLFLGTMEGEE